MTAQTRWIEQRPPKGERCRRRNDAGRYCNRVIAPEQREKGWTWDAECVKEHHAAKRAEAKSSKPAPKRAAKKDNVIKLPASVLPEAPIAPEAMAAFVSPELAKQQITKRRAAKAKQPAKS